MPSSDAELDQLEAFASARRRRIVLAVLVALVLLLVVGGLHAVGVLPPGG